LPTAGVPLRAWADFTVSDRRSARIYRGDVKILVADDDRLMSQLVCAVVREAGHVPLAAFDAMQALMFAMRPPVPALIILDINMPGGTGLEALRKLKLSARTAPIPVIVLSGSSELDMPEQVKSLGADEFLSKPIDPEVLTLAIQRVLREAEKVR
jgi:CheY-like chemotaxis protein